MIFMRCGDIRIELLKRQPLSAWYLARYANYMRKKLIVDGICWSTGNEIENWQNVRVAGVRTSSLRLIPTTPRNEKTFVRWP